MVCPQCGQSVAVDVPVCPQCGQVLRVSGLRVRRPKGVDMATAKRATLTPTHPRVPQAAATPALADTTDPWSSEWLATAKRPLSADEADGRNARSYLLPGIVAVVLLVACGGLVLLLHSTLLASPVAPVKAPVSATQTSAPTATTTSDGTTIIAPTATTAGYTPPRHTATATPKALPTATATSPIVVVTTTVNPTATASGTKTATPKPTATP